MIFPYILLVLFATFNCFAQLAMDEAISDLSSNVAFAPLSASGDKGNNGGGEVCQGKSPVSRDIYEGLHNGLVIPSYRQFSSNELIQIILKKIIHEDLDLGLDVWQQLKSILNASSFFNNTDYVARLFDQTFLNSKLILTNDALDVPQYNDATIINYDPACHYEPIASWDNTTDLLTVFRPLFSELTQRDQIALLIHEALYKVARDRKKAVNSDVIRKLVADLFSTRLTSTHFHLFH